jgi:hypothetical protein
MTEDFSSFLATDARTKRRLPVDLQRLWRLDRGLCPVHGQPLSLSIQAEPIDRASDLLLWNVLLRVAGPRFQHGTGISRAMRIVPIALRALATEIGV